MRQIALSIFLGFILTYCVIYLAAALGGEFTPGAGSVIGFAVGFAKAYTTDNDMFSLCTFTLLIACILGGATAGLEV